MTAARRVSRHDPYQAALDAPVPGVRISHPKPLQDDRARAIRVLARVERTCCDGQCTQGRECPRRPRPQPSRLLALLDTLCLVIAYPLLVLALFTAPSWAAGLLHWIKS